VFTPKKRPNRVAIIGIATTSHQPLVCRRKPAAKTNEQERIANGKTVTKRRYGI
jgi:hypothetical protein